MHQTRVFWVIMCFFCIPLQTKAQVLSTRIGGAINVNFYGGDLVPDKAFELYGGTPGLSMFVAKDYYGLMISGGVDAGYMAVKESRYSHIDAWRTARNFGFKTLFFSGSLTAQIHFLKLARREEMKSWWDTRKKVRLSPYVLSGIGLLYTNPDISYGAFDSTKFPTQISEGLKKDVANNGVNISLVIPCGGGVEYQLNDNVSVFAHFKWHFMFSDYIDGFKYANVSSQNDSYTTIGIGLHCTVGRVEYKKYGEL